MKIRWTQVIEVGLLCISLVEGLRDIGLFPVCMTDKDCILVSNTQTRQNMAPDYRCFQYMCYPWNWPWKEQRPFRKCKGNIECTAKPSTSTISTNQGSQDYKDVTKGVKAVPEDGVCVLHQDIENVPHGICLPKREAVQCSVHKECQDDQKCINGYCGDPAYFSALASLPCSSDSCQQLLLGDQCCLQLSPSYNPPWHVPKPKWPNKCCSNKDGSLIIQPEDNLSDHEIDYVNRIVEAMSLAGLAGVVCHSLKDDLRDRLESCSPHKLVNQPTDPGLAWSPGRELVASLNEEQGVKQDTRAGVVNAWIKDKIKAARRSNANNNIQHRNDPVAVELNESNPVRIVVVCVSILLLVSVIYLIFTTIFTVGQLASRHLVATKDRRRPKPRCRKDTSKFESVQHPYFWYSDRASPPSTDAELL